MVDLHDSEAPILLDYSCESTIFVNGRPRYLIRDDHVCTQREVIWTDLNVSGDDHSPMALPPCAVELK